MTYLSQRDVERTIWIAEEARPEHVKAVETRNERGMGKIWMVTVRAIAIGDSAPAPLFAVVAEPAEVEKTVESTELTQSQVKRREFLATLFAQARDEGTDSPFKNLAPSVHGILYTPARGQGLVYRIAVNRHRSRVVLTNARGKWLGALAALIENRLKIDQDFAAASLQQPLEWTGTVTAGRWVIRYEVDVNLPGRTRLVQDGRTQPGRGGDEACVRPVPPATRSPTRRTCLRTVDRIAAQARKGGRHYGCFCFMKGHPATTHMNDCTSIRSRAPRDRSRSSSRLLRINSRS